VATEVLLPQWGMGMTEGRIAKWLKAEGDRVQEGEPIVEVETAKAVQELEAPASGILARIIVPEEETVPVRELLAIITEPGESFPE
jgi:pyruvate dehydrogenase E2 component (dihydrolipoamide acetyltransferase)